MRKMAAIFGVVIVLILLIWWLFNYLSVGRVVISTANPNSVILLSKINSEAYKAGDKTFSVQAHNKLSVSAKTGRYIASVRGGSAAVAQVITLKAHHTQSYSINPPEAKGVEPVIDKNAYSIKADSSRLLFAALPDKTLNLVNAQNNVSVFDPRYSFQSIKWADSFYGIGKGTDGHLYVINNTSISVLKVPFSYDSSKAVSYDLASNRQIYVSSGLDVYSGNEKTGLKKIYTAESANLSLAAAPDKVIVLDAGAKGSQKNKATVTVIDQQGGSIQKNIEAYAAAWSRSGKYLAISSDAESMVVDSSLHEAAAIPHSNIVSPIWLDDTTLFYSVADQLWSYNLPSQKAELIANMPLGAPIIELSVDNNGQYIYLTVGRNNSDIRIKRVGLKGQAVPKAVYQLQDILPLILDQCSLSLINFTRPTVVVGSGIGSAQKVCDQAVRSELQQDGFDLSQLQLQFSN